MDDPAPLTANQLAMSGSPVRAAPKRRRTVEDDAALDIGECEEEEAVQGGGEEEDVSSGSPSKEAAARAAVHLAEHLMYRTAGDSEDSLTTVPDAPPAEWEFRAFLLGDAPPLPSGPNPDRIALTARLYRSTRFPAQTRSYAAASEEDAASSSVVRIPCAARSSPSTAWVLAFSLEDWISAMREVGGPRAFDTSQAMHAIMRALQARGGALVSLAAQKLLPSAPLSPHEDATTATAEEEDEEEEDDEEPPASASEGTVSSRLARWGLSSATQLQRELLFSKLRRVRTDSPSHREERVVPVCLLPFLMAHAPMAPRMRLVRDSARSAALAVQCRAAILRACAMQRNADPTPLLFLLHSSLRWLCPAAVASPPSPLLSLAAAAARPPPRGPSPTAAASGDRVVVECGDQCTVSHVRDGFFEAVQKEATDLVLRCRNVSRSGRSLILSLECYVSARLTIHVELAQDAPSSL
jgi:hypothetical protein